MANDVGPRLRIPVVSGRSTCCDVLEGIPGYKRERRYRRDAQQSVKLLDRPAPIVLEVHPQIDVAG
ncbi:MAG: hypothetical protein AMXMBFR4_01310 [Candidatus Hydrogenedentota bacterium]